MQKIRLLVEDLRVDTFAVSPEPQGGPGTVLGHSGLNLSALPGVQCRGSEESHFVACERGTYPEPSTCNHTVCDCDQAAPLTGEPGPEHPV